MSQTETQKGSFPELWGAITSPEKRLAKTLEGAKELVEKHPKIALLAAVAGGIFLYEEYAHHYAERTGEKLGGPFALIRDVADRLEHNPEGLKEEGHHAIDAFGTFMRKHKMLTFGLAITGPIIVEKIGKKFEAKNQPATPLRPRR